LRPLRAALTRSLGSVVIAVQGALGTPLAVEDVDVNDEVFDAAVFAA
jgi:hypothetical protein